MINFALRDWRRRPRLVPGRCGLLQRYIKTEVAVWVLGKNLWVLNLLVAFSVHWPRQCAV